MKHIDKREPPDSFVQWCTSHPQKNWTIFSDPQNSNTKRILSDQLLNEQGTICCYCEQRIDSYSAHIEHIKPRSQFPIDEFSYNNLLGSCNGNPANPKNDCCGNKKKGWFSSTMVSPLSADCEERFTYTGYGQILPRVQTDHNAKDTIEYLGLDNPKLRAMRKVVFKEIEAYRSGLNQAEFVQYIQEMLQRDSSGCYCQFWTTVSEFAENN